MTQNSTKLKFLNEITWVDIKKVHPNDYNPNFMPQQKLDELKQDIKTGKFYGAIIIRKDGTIIDGEHRWKALKSLGAKQVPCIIEASADDDDAKIITVRMNRQRGYLTPVETGNVLSKLQKKIPIDILSKRTGIPLAELNLLTNLKYDPKHDVETVTDKSVAWAKIDAILNKLHIALREHERFDTIYYTGRGGLVPARLIADRLDITKIESIDQPRTIKKPGRVLFVDDIYDTGQTYTRVHQIRKEIKTFVYLYSRRGADLPNDVLAGMETEGHEYVIFPWDRFEFKKSSKTNLK